MLKKITNKNTYKRNINNYFLQSNMKFYCYIYINLIYLIYEHVFTFLINLLIFSGLQVLLIIDRQQSTHINNVIIWLNYSTKFLYTFFFKKFPFSLRKCFEINMLLTIVNIVILDNDMARLTCIHKHLQHYMKEILEWMVNIATFRLYLLPFTVIF